MRVGNLDFALVVAPVVIQDSETGQNALRFAYPIEAIERDINTLWPFLHMTLEEVDLIVP